MDFALSSRDALAEALLAAGPSAPTLCEGWEARHLAAHLVLREHSVWAAGIVGGPLRAGMERRLASMADAASSPADFAALVATFRAGPGKLSPLRAAKVDAAANLLEYFVHTEDVRRAREQWAPRALEGAYAAALWGQLLQRSAVLLRKAPVGVILVRPDGVRARARRGADSVAVTGGIGELVLYLHGRGEHALVTFEGAPEAVAALRGFRPTV
ncbi:TIGR03085 family protein [Galactobacter valiniphilus]|uniref:TIGR03085 family protein n=1 Tax=Galactobacter valiniphilus TaxID=2676122 RepID=A0A399J823_9MICC|nr:TIGR03085 family metal-binding protein [Galactobacter valiniphilus]RII41705.1 TIGR03085 family protein [Galactobacter valiniphilus]